MSAKHPPLEVEKTSLNTRGAIASKSIMTAHDTLGSRELRGTGSLASNKSVGVHFCWKLKNKLEVTVADRRKRREFSTVNETVAA